MYNANKELFDSFAQMASKNSFDIDGYFKYCVSHGMTEKTLSTCLSSPTMMYKYDAHLKRATSRKKIYKWFLKSARNIAQQCVDKGLFTSKDFLRSLVEEH